MNSYRVLKNQSISFGEYALVPIRFEDRYKIMQWRNEQIYHLRQNKPLTEKEQDQYFNEVVAKLFEQDKPNQILFSYLENGECIGYGGLVHINWVDKNAEISFIIDTKLEKEGFHKHWSIYLQLIEKFAFVELSLHKIYTFAFNLRPNLYTALENSAFKKEAELKEHCLFDKNYISVIIHSKLNLGINLREANDGDLLDTFSWVNNETIRMFSLSKNNVTLEEHTNWFKNKINDKNCFYLIASIKEEKIGSIRFDVINKEYAQISYLLKPEWHGKGIGLQILNTGVNLFLENHKINEVRGLVLTSNVASIKVFNRLGFIKIKEEEDSILFSKKRIV